MTQIPQRQRRTTYQWQNDFGEVVPGLCSNLGTAEGNIIFSHNAYKLIVLQLEGYSDIIQRVRNQLRKPSLKKDEARVRSLR
jgi:hypothetical protein